MTNNLTEEAQDLFFDGFSCAQSVLAVYAEDLGMPRNQAFNIACGFGAGMARLQMTCGAVTGGIMVIGLKYGKSASDENDRKELTYSKVREFTRLFDEKFGSTTCLQLVKGCDFTTHEGLQRYENEQLEFHVCGEVVKYAVELLQDILND